MISELIEYRDLIWLWMMREVQVRYKQSLLGIGWAVLQPLAITVIFTIVFSRIVKVDTGGIPYPIFSYVAVVPWTFFAMSIGAGTSSLVANMNLVTKIYFPREVLPLASIGAAFVDFLVSATILFGMMLVFGVLPGWVALWCLPLLFLQILLTIGVVLSGSALLVFFRDVRFVVPLIIQIWMYATPIIYPASLVPEQYRGLYYLNPMAGIIEGYRGALLTGEAPVPYTLVLATATTLVLLIVGIFVFKRSEPHFADLI